MLFAVVLTTALGIAPADTLPPADPDPEPIAADAYLDPMARDALARLRALQARSDEGVAEYRVLARQRVRVGLNAFRRERLLYQSEQAARVHWVRDGEGSVELLVAREASPTLWTGTRAPEERSLRSNALGFAFDPSDRWLLRPAGSSGFRHPLGRGSERDYRFRTADSTSIRLADGSTLRLLELEVIPRRADPELVAGSIWIDRATDAPVRGVFRLSTPLRMNMRVAVDSATIAAGRRRGLRIPTPDLSADLRFMTVEYGLWEDRFWLPRLVALEGSVKIGDRLEIPARMEQSYTGYEVARPGEALPDVEPLISLADNRFEEEVVTERCRDDVCRSYRVRIPTDSVLLGGSILEAAGEDLAADLVSEREVREIAELFGAGRLLGSGPLPPRLSYRHPLAGMLRYNRVEGLALGAEAVVDADRASIGAEAWLGTASLQPSAELRLERGGFSATHRLTGFHRLDVMGGERASFGLGATLSGLVLGRDDHDYHRATGLEIRSAPVGLRGWGYEWRLFGERQRPVEKETDLSARRLFSGDHQLAPNRAADAADQIGATAALHLTRGADGSGVRWGASVEGLASTGDYRFARGGVAGWTALPLLAGLTGALEVAAGTSAGDLPIQSLWHLGGPRTVRGFGVEDRVLGEAHWRGRAEIGTRGPAVRATLFGDAAWAGPRGDFQLEPTLLSAGAGASFLDGLLRADLSRPLRGARGWRLDLYLDGLF